MASIGTALNAIFRGAGLAPPTMHMDLVVGQSPDFSQGLHDLLCSLRPQIERFGLKLEGLGDFHTLPHRLQAELAASNGGSCMVRRCCRCLVAKTHRVGRAKL